MKVNLEILPIQKEALSFLMQVEALKEGWFYSQEDVDFYYACSQNAIYAVHVDNQLAGCVILHQSLSHLDNKPIYSAGFFLVLNAYRGKKIVGPYLWHHAITKHLDENSLVCFHAVPRAVAYYERLNFKKTPLINRYLTLKKEHLNAASLKAAVAQLESKVLKVLNRNALPEIDRYNNQLFSGDAGRGIREWVHQWIRRSDAVVVGCYYEGDLQGYGVATLCKKLSQKISYRISPLYADTNQAAQSILKGLILAVPEGSFSHIELNTLFTSETQFGNQLLDLGFIEGGKNFIVCNKPDLIRKEAPVLQHVFCSVPLEYPHEVITGI